MNQLISSVNFIEDGHKYEYKGNAVKYSLTQALRLLGISPDYSFVDKDVLERSATRGTFIHNQLQHFDENGCFDEDFGVDVNDYFNKEAYINMISKYEVLANEFAVSNENLIATKIDKILRDKETGEIIVADVKTTSSKHSKSVSYQCSFGADMLEKQHNIKVDKTMLIWIKPDKSIEFIDLESVDKDIINIAYKALENEDFDSFKEMQVTESGELSVSEESIITLRDCMIEIARLEEKKKEINKMVLNAMREGNIETITIGGVMFSYKKPYKRKSFSTSALQKDNPKLDLTKYYTETQVGDSVSMKLVDNVKWNLLNITCLEDYCEFFQTNYLSLKKDKALFELAVHHGKELRSDREEKEIEMLNREEIKQLIDFFGLCV